MKYLILTIAVLLFSGCSLVTKHKELKPTRQDNVIRCVDGFLQQDIVAKISYDICKDIYQKGK